MGGPANRGKYAIPFRGASAETSQICFFWFNYPCSSAIGLGTLLAFVSLSLCTWYAASRSSKAALQPSLITALVTLIFYTVSISSHPVPGESAQWTAAAAGLTEAPRTIGPLWFAATQIVAGIPLGSLSFRIGLLSALSGAVCAAFVYSLTVCMVARVPIRRHTPLFFAISGTAAALAFVVAVPIWTSANRAHPALLQFAVFLGAVASLHRYTLTAHHGFLAIAGLLTGLGLFEWPLFPFLLPVACVFLIIRMAQLGELSEGPILMAFASVTFGFGLFIMLFVWQLYFSGAPPTTGLIEAAVTLWKSNQSYCFSSFLNPADLAITSVGVTVWLIVLMSLQQGDVSEESYSGTRLLHFLLTVAVLIVLLLGNIIPEFYKNPHSIIVVASTATLAVAFGYLWPGSGPGPDPARRRSRALQRYGCRRDGCPVR